MKRTSDKVILEVLDKIERQLKRLNKKVDLLIKSQSSTLKKSLIKEYGEFIEATDTPLDIVALLALPDHLRKTAMAMHELRKATAEMVSKKTGRRRATESASLNQLVRMQYLNKRREGLEVFFFFEGEVDVRE